MVPLTACSPFVDCSPLLGDSARLRAAAAERGYLYFRGLLPVADVLAVRRAVLQVTAAHGALDDAAELEAGLARPGVHLTEYDHTPEFRAYYSDLQRLRVFHALPHHPRLMSGPGAVARRGGVGAPPPHRPRDLSRRPRLHHAAASGFPSGARHARHLDRMATVRRLR